MTPPAVLIDAPGKAASLACFFLVCQLRATHGIQSGLEWHPRGRTTRKVHGLIGLTRQNGRTNKYSPHPFTHWYIVRDSMGCRSRLMQKERGVKEKEKDGEGGEKRGYQQKRGGGTIPYHITSGVIEVSHTLGFSSAFK